MDEARQARPVTPPFVNRRLGVLISGRGSNLQAIGAAIGSGQLDATIGVVISNNADAPGLAHARQGGLHTLTISHRGWSRREDYDRVLVSALREHEVGLVCLAGFMRLLSAPVLEAYPQAVLNVHPSLLPAFPGTKAQERAWAHGAKVSGATVHLLDTELDGGPIILQGAVPVLQDDTPETLADRILAEEHRLYPEAIRLVLAGGWRIEGRRFLCVGT